MNYNDYIIKNNSEFIREFDAMYREVDDPWGQAARGTEDTSFNILIEVLKKIFNGKKIVDVGCGPGHLSSAMKRELKAEEYIGCDISEIAIEKAKAANPSLEFVVHNIIDATLPFEADLITVLKTLYYCAPEIDITIRNLHSMLKSGGFLVYTYNLKDDSFTKRYLDIETLRAKLEAGGLFKKKYISDFYIGSERVAIDVFEKI